MSEPEEFSDPRIATYLKMIEEVEREHLDTKWVNPALSQDSRDEIAVLGESLTSLSTGLHARFEQERAIAEVSREITHGVYRDEVLDCTYDSFRPLIPYDRIGCALLERKDTILRAQWARIEYEQARLKVGYAAKMSGSSLQTIIETGKPRIINDLVEYLRLHPKSMATKLIVEEGVRSSLTCPLIARGRPIGFLFFSSTSANCYATVHQEVFLQMADLVSIAVEKSLIYEELSTLNRDLAQARTLLEYRATHDGLTGLLNHDAIIAEVVGRADEEPSWPYSQSRSLGVIMLDIDHFKVVNDTHGHPVGDQVLRSVSETLAAALRSSDFVGRYGGEEFLIVAEGYDEVGELRALAERLRFAIEQHLMVTDAGSIPITISVGLAVTIPDAREDAASLIRRADGALYEAKTTGRNRVAVA